MTNPSYPVSTIAQLFQITERRVQQLVAEKVIPKAATGKYELAPCIQGYIKYLRERSVGKDNASSDACIAKARLLKGQADKLELEIEEIKKNVVPAEHVLNTWTGMILRCRSALLSIPSKLAYQVSTLKDPKAAEELIKASVEEALEELASEDIKRVA